MPGKQVKNWAMYEELIKSGYSKAEAARITNSKYGNRSRTQSRKSKRRRGVRTK